MNRNEQLFNRAKAIIPGGVNSPVRAFGSVGGIPRFIKKAEGAYVWDENDMRYIDYVGSWGPAIVGHAHPELQGFRLPAREPDGFFELVPQRKDLLGIAQRHAALAGQLQAAPPLAEQVVAQPFFQLLDLARQRLRGGVQLLTRPHHAACLGHRPEVIQMVKVEMAYSLHSLFKNISLISIYFN